MDSYILCGMQFGDEGKGTFVDYLSFEQNIDCVVRYNGGSQASHTVITPEGIKHKFSQLGSGMFLANCHTYLTENMVINLDNLCVEMEIFSQKTGIDIPELLERIHIHKNCFIVTPYHKLMNKLRELSQGSHRRGSVGTGVSEVRYFLEESKRLEQEPVLGLQVKDIFHSDKKDALQSIMKALQNYVEEFYQKQRYPIWYNAPAEMQEHLHQEVDFLLRPKSYVRMALRYEKKFKEVPEEFRFSKCLYEDQESIWQNCQSAIFEGSQGLLLDANYGIWPNTTFLDTTNHFAQELSKLCENIRKIGITKAFTSRHGCGVFPTESGEVSSKVYDPNQEESFWNGRIRFGWFDAILFRYAQSINKVDEIYLSSLDQLDDFETIKVCNEYLYQGKMDETFVKVFSYREEASGQVVITDIKGEAKKIGQYLEQCIPRYREVQGWKCDLSKVHTKSALPKEALDYICLLEDLTGLPISIVSVGPTRKDKIRM